MARIRNIKPGFWSNEDLAEMDFQTRLLYIGLWGLADVDGRLEDRPKRIKGAVFPYDDGDVNAMLQGLHDAKFIIRWTNDDGQKYIWIPTFREHQAFNLKERQAGSKLPKCPEESAKTEKSESDTTKKHHPNTIPAPSQHHPNTIPGPKRDHTDTVDEGRRKKEEGQRTKDNGRRTKEDSPPLLAGWIRKAILDAKYPALTENQISELTELVIEVDETQLRSELLKFADHYQKKPSDAKTPDSYRTMVNWLGRVDWNSKQQSKHRADDEYEDVRLPSAV